MRLMARDYESGKEDRSLIMELFASTASTLEEDEDSLDEIDYEGLSSLRQSGACNPHVKDKLFQSENKRLERLKNNDFPFGYPLTIN